MAIIFTLIGSTLAVVLLTSSWSWYTNKRKAQLPPGPKPLPFLGNILDLPPKGAVEFWHWLKHKDMYGSLSSVTALGQTMILVHDRKAAKYLLEKRSVVTASRPHMEFAHVMCRFDDLFAMQPYDEKYRRRRKLVQKALGTKTAVTKYESIQEVASKQLLLNILEEPSDFAQHSQTFASSIVLDITYGYTVKTKFDPLISLVCGTLDKTKLVFAPMSFLVDLVPVLKYLPIWLPGYRLKTLAQECTETLRKTATVPFSTVQQQMLDNIHRPSMVSSLLTDVKSEKIDASYLEDVKWTAAMQCIAGVETVSATLEWFLLAMVLNPHVQKKAQEEICRVTGNERLPTFSDREKLPYVNNLITEVGRWFPVSPMALPHKSDEDIIYEDYLIPKDAYILPSVWWFCNDPEVYDNPSIFDPERFEKPRSEPDPREHIFGYGRRICPGRFAADAAIFIAVANILAAFSISKALDDLGKEIPVDSVPTSSVVCYPAPFQFRIIPRINRLANLVRGSNSEPQDYVTDGDARMMA